MKINYLKIGYGIFSVLAGLTVGVFLALFIATCSFFNALVGFPMQIYRQLNQAAQARRLQKLFGIPNDVEFADAKQPNEESIWDKHVQRMEEKKPRNQNEN